MQELLNIRKIDKLILELKETSLSQDGELDLLDDISTFLNSASLNKAQVLRDLERMWQDMYNSYIIQAKAGILSNLDRYEPMSMAVKSNLADSLRFAKHCATTIIAMRYNFSSIIAQIQSGTPKDKALPPKLVQEIVNINMTPADFLREFVPYIQESREAISNIIELEDDEVETLINLCDSQETAAALVLNIASISEVALREMLDATVISAESIKKAVEAF